MCILGSRCFNDLYEVTRAFRITPCSRYIDGRRLVINDELQSRILCGQVTVRSEVTSINDRGVQFRDGTREDGIDVIVCATGYRFRLVHVTGAT